MTDADRPPLDERLTTKSAMESGTPEGVAAFPDQMAEPVDLALDRLAEMDGQSDDTDTRPDLTVAEAARLAKVNPRTIRRRLTQGSVLPNAHRDASGQWLIPPDDLVAAGFDLSDTDASEPNLSTPESTAVTDSPVDSAEQATGLGERSTSDPDAWRRRAEVAEALVAEVRERLADKDATIAASAGTVEAQNATITSMHRQLIDREAEVAALSRKAEALDAGAGTMALDVTPGRPEPTDDTDLRAELADAIRRAGVKGVRGSAPAPSTKPLPPPHLPPARRRWWSRS